MGLIATFFMSLCNSGTTYMFSIPGVAFFNKLALYFSNTKWCCSVTIKVNDLSRNLHQTRNTNAVMFSIRTVCLLNMFDQG